MARQNTNSDSWDGRADLSSIPNKNINEEYWRRKLPPGFRYVLDVVARNVMRDSPDDMNMYAAVLLEEIQLQRKKERSLLPDWPYFNKFLARVDKSRVPPKPNSPAPCKSGERLRKCCKCGRIIASEPQGATGLFYDGSGALLDSRKLQCADGCRVLTLDLRKDKFGHREITRDYPEGEPYIISCRSMAMLLDY